MKKIIATICVVGSTFALSACDTVKNTDANYAIETLRTAGQSTIVDVATPSRVTPARVAPAEQVFRRAQTK